MVRSSRSSSKSSVATMIILRAARIISTIRTVAIVAVATTIQSSTMVAMAAEQTITPSRSMVAGPRQRQASHTSRPMVDQVAIKSRQGRHPRLDNLSTRAVVKLKTSHKLLQLSRWSRRSLQCLWGNSSKLPSSACNPKLARPHSNLLGPPYQCLLLLLRRPSRSNRLARVVVPWSLSPPKVVMSA